jgi:anti-anti-sigma regulatory factor
MLRITRSSPSPSAVVLKAEGQLVAEWVGLLETECRELLGTNQRVILDLAEVNYLDRRAVRLLRELTRGSLALVNCPPLVEQLLTEEAAG